MLEGKNYLTEHQDLSAYALIAESGYSLGLSIDSNYIMTLELKNKTGAVLDTRQIDLPLESMIIGASYTDGTLTLTLQNGGTTECDISAIVSGLVADTLTIAGIDLKDAITKEELLGALELTSVVTDIKNLQAAVEGLQTAKANASDLAAVATSGNYSDLSDKPTIPSVGDGTITINQNGTEKGSFTTNQSGNITINLTDTNTQTVTGVKGNAETSYRIDNVNITPENIGLGNVANVLQYSASNPQPSVAGSSGSCTGNASTATILATARTINGTSFDGSANITTTNWGTARTLSWTGDATGSMSVNGSANASAALTLASSGVTAGSYGQSVNASPAHSGTFSVPYITVDAKGRVTSASTKTITLPSDNNTDTHYTSKNVVGSSTATSNTTSALTNGNVYLNSVENGSVTSAHKISGSGATTVTSDSSGNIVITSTDTTYNTATTSSNGLMSTTDKTKLNGIATGAEVNQNAFSNIVVNTTTVSADSKTDTLTLVAGDNIDITPDATNDKITISCTYDNPTFSVGSDGHLYMQH